MATHTYGEGESDRWSSGAEAWYRSLVERVPAVLYVDTSDEARSALYINPHGEYLLGYSRKEWLEDPDLWLKILHPDDRDRVLAEHLWARGEGGPFEAEYRLIARDGSVVDVRDEAALVEGEEGRPGQRVGVLLDITERRLYEERLRESEGRFRELVENAIEGIARISPEGGTIEHCNLAYARALGLTQKEAVGRSFFEFVEGDDEREVRRQRELRLSGVGSEYEVTITAADGEEKILLCGGYPLHGPDGAYEGAVQTVADVTGRRRAEEALRKSEERFRLVARVTGEAIWDNDLATGVQDWDGATEALFGYPSDRARTGTWWEERIHPQDKEKVLSGLATVLEGGGERWEEEYRFRRADGSYAHVLDRARVVRDGEGRPVRMVGSMADVTEGKEHEEELRESEERFRMTFEAAGVGMAHVAPDGSWLRINGKLAEITGYPSEELLERTFQDITHPDDLEKSLEHVRRITAGEIDGYSMQKRYLRKDGRRVWVEITVSALRAASGELACFVSVVEDISERKLKELTPDALTPLEVAVLRLVVEGRTNPQVAASIAHSVGTVKLDLHRVIGKLGVKNRREAAIRAVEMGLVPPVG